MLLLLWSAGHRNFSPRAWVTAPPGNRAGGRRIPIALQLPSPHIACALSRRHRPALATSLAVLLCPQEDGLYLLVSEVCKGLEDPARRKGAAAAAAAFCRATRLDFQEHVPALITVGGWVGGWAPGGG